ncbi:hypothetical protein [Agromyces atrinae]|uniref:Uncharacterized protein n=1 Tax=Agromyces atrinae TaxID=592376 RepID=A0A4Q2M5Y5_9MICO|nr:hypothetical protein [Agromyces atrinae]NYD66975.1 hypothetical protein [Agromyces atrinae]RXZ85291.1 hypothetical protein ESP50_16420 [Agromyces atrinae]RXZ85399.1 hypothetical protein ESP50_15825 [Agromyces atrinae]
MGEAARPVPSGAPRSGNERRPMRRLVFLIPGALALILGLAAALSLLGLPVLRFERLRDLHAPLLVFGFLTTLISLERAVALRRRLPFAAPVLTGLGALACLTPLPVVVGASAVTAGLGVLLVAYGLIWKRQPAVATAIQALGAAAAVCGAVLWAAGVPVPWVVPFLVVFLVLTIAGERVELARIAFAGPRPEALAFLSAVALAVAAVLALCWPDVGGRLLGAALVLTCAWLVRFDIATKTVRSVALARFTAVCLLAGYAWLAVAGVIWLLGAPVLDGPAYDAAVHAVFLGFVMSMIMAHAPLILPAVLAIRLPYRPVMYVPVALLHTSLAVRLAGDALDEIVVVRVGGVGGIVAILGFFVIAAVSAVTAARRPRSTA